MIIRLTEKSKRASWHRHLDNISPSKDTKLAQSTVRSLSGKESHTTGMSLLHSARVYASDGANASDFIQEYAKISGSKVIGTPRMH